MRVYVARHGETDWNVAGRYQGRRESTLTPLGRRQAAALATAMTAAGVQRVVSSPLARCVESARPTAERLRVPLERDERLIEIAHGTWEGRLKDEIAASDAERWRTWREEPGRVAFEGGETLPDVRKRWSAFARDLRPSVPTLVVTHDAVLRVALLEALGHSLDDFWEMSVENGGYAEFDVDGGTWTPVTVNATAHLAGLRVSTTGQAL